MASDEPVGRPQERLRAFQALRRDAVVTMEKTSRELEQRWRTN